MDSSRWTAAELKRVRVDSGEEPVFVEDRTDCRLLIASTGHREMTVTQTRGGALGGSGERWHVSDPDSMPIEIPASDRSRLARAREDHHRRVESLERAVTEGAQRAVAGRGSRDWTARVVSFWQSVWVGSSPARLSTDLRSGCRLEIRASFGGGTAVQDLVTTGHEVGAIQAAFGRAFDRSELLRIARAAPMVGPCTGVFAPGAAGVIVHELIGHALEGDVVARGDSWIANSRMPNPRRPFSVTDDPRQGRGAWSIDDEGTPVRATQLVDSGRAVGTLLDRTAAATLGSGSTGHGRRSSYLDPVRPRMGCTFIEAGTDDPPAVVRETTSGLFIRRLASGHTHTEKGVATFIVTDADRIVDGRVAEPLSPFVIEIDGRSLWTSLDRIAHDLEFDRCVGSCIREGQPLVVSVGAPTIRIGLISVLR